MEAIQTKLLCDIASVFTSGTGGTGPWVLKAGDTMTGALNINLGTTPSVSGGILHISTDTTATGLTILEQASTDNDGYDLSFRKERGTVAVPLAITSGATIGSINFEGYSGASGYVGSSSIYAKSEGTVADTRVPGILIFATGTNAAPSVLTDRWSIDSSGHLLARTDNAWDIGASAATRPRNIFAGSNIVADVNITSNTGSIVTSSGGGFVINTKSRIKSSADGLVELFNNGSTNFTRLNFGGTTNSFSAISRDAVNGFTLQSAAGTATWNDASTAGSATVTERYLWGIATPTLTGTNTLITYTRASSFFIGGAPIGSANITIGTAYALNVSTGVSNFGGNINMPDVNLVLGTGAGTKIGTATGQKLAFWNKAPIIQPTNAIAAAAFVANTSLIANDTATFGGYTIGQIAAALIATGILT